MRLPPVVYVAGPYRGPSAWVVEQNIRAAEALALEAWKLGWAAICPHANSRFFSGAAPDDVWLLGDLAILTKCDAVLMVPGWQHSEGARQERTVARSLKIPVVETLADLAAISVSPRPR